MSISQGLNSIKNSLEAPEQEKRLEFPRHELAGVGSGGVINWGLAAAGRAFFS